MNNYASTEERPSGVPQTRGLIRCHADAWELFGIYLVNLMLTVLTLGIYRFWAKTRIRRYLWGNVEILGDRLEYTGTGKELFLGFLLVFFLILLPLFGGLGALDAALAGENEELRAALGFVQMILVVFLVGVALFRARRYRLTRTHWRGIYGAQTGSSLKYGLLAMASYVLSGLTLGLAWPVCSVWMKRYEMSNTWIGNEQPEFSPRLKALYKPFLVAWAIGWLCLGLVAMSYEAVMASLMTAEPSPEEMTASMGELIAANLLLIPLFIVVWWYRGRAMHHFVSVTRFHGHDLTSSITGLGFMWLIFGNLLLVLFTAGFGTPFTYKRILTFVEKRVGLSGSGDFSALLQSTREKPSTGEGLADAFDVGGF